MDNNNEYFETMKPMLYILKITGVYPFQLQQKDNFVRFFISKIMAAGAIVIYLITAVSNLIYFFRRINILLSNFNLNLLLSMAAALLVRIFIFIIPFTTWNKSKHLIDYWNNWKLFQERYTKISGKAFKTSIKIYIRWAVVTIFLITFIFLGITQISYYHGVVTLNFVSGSFLIVTANTITAYWVINYVFTKLAAVEILNLVQITVEEGTDGRKLYQLTTLWLTLCELVEQFNELHSILFLCYFVFIIVVSVISFYSGVIFFTFQRHTWTFMIHFFSFMMCMVVILLYCEIAHSVMKQTYFKLETILLLQHASGTNTRMLTSIWSFLQTMQTKNPQLNFNGFLTLNRSLFPSIVSVGINYLIVLRQFSTQNRK